MTLKMSLLCHAAQTRWSKVASFVPRIHSSRHHGKKNDKETQSPKLKIFNDIMQIDNLDMEKNNQPVASSAGPETAANNTMDNTGKNMNSFNRNVNGGGKPFNNDNTVNTTANGNGNVVKKKSRTRKKSPERSTSGSPKRPKKKAEKNFEETVVTTNNIENQTLPLQNEKSFADKFWKQCNQPECKQTEDTFSCVSCALKKIASSEHACIGCLIVLFVVSLVVAVMVVCRTTLLAPDDEWAGANSDELKKRIEKVKEDNRIKEELSGIRGVRSHWRDKPVPFNGLTDDAAFGPNLRDMNAFEGSESKLSGYLSSLLDPDKTSEFQNNERLREFYRKLLQADVQIQNLKKFDGMGEGVNMDELEFIPNRKKRSLRSRFRNNRRHGHISKDKRLNKTEVLTPVGKKLGDHVQRFKRHNNISEQPLSFIIEKKKIVVQIKPKNSKKVPKCSHTPKDSHTHEKLLNHPFYKNTQRLDEWLDALLSKDIPNVLSDTFTLNEFLTQGKNMHPDINDVKSFRSQTTDIGEKFDKNILSTEEKSDKVSEYLKILDTDTIYTPASTTELSEYSALMKQYSTYEVPTDKSLSSTPNYGFEFSTSGMNTETTTAQSPWDQSLLDRVPNLRRLMQLNGEENEFGYEDFNNDNQHEFENHVKDRSKRMEDTPSHMEEYKTANPSNINNPNWKGPMPLYPDELSIMAKHAINNKNDEFKRSTEDVSTETNIPQIEVNKADNYQDYFNKRYDNIGVARMAQDYSDYGVLNEKKVYVKNEKHSSFGDKKDRYKFSFDAKTDLKRGPPLRPESEGVKFKFLSAPPKPKEHIDDFSKVNDVLDIPESDSGFDSFEEQKISKSNSSDKSFSKMLENHFKIINVKSVGASGKQIMKQDELVTRNSWKPDDSWMLMKKLNTKRNLLSLDMALIERKNASIDETTTNNNYGSVGMSNNTVGSQQKIEKEFSAIKYELENITKHFRNNSTRITPNETTAEYDTQDNISDIDSLPIVLLFNDDDLTRNDNSTVIEGIYSDTKNNIDLLDYIKKPTSFKRDILNLTSAISGNLDANDANVTINLIKNVTTNETSISDALSAISSLFAALDGAEILFPPVNMRSSIMNNFVESKSVTKITTTSNTYPLYDTEEFENIGHKTRVLLSANEDTVNRTNENILINHIPILNHTEVLPDSGSNISHKLENVVKAENTSQLDNRNNTNIRREVNKENKTIVKRNADDSNLIFWNDIYDDEYGVETGRLDDAVRDKHSVKGNGFIKKSGKWMQDKIKKFADNIIKTSASMPGTGKKRSIREANSINGMNTLSKNVLYKSKRQAKTTAELAFENQKSAFAALTMNMKEVCKKAAEAVHQTKHVREKPKEESLSTSLMQQLLSLMNDLVDYQVQQKTCAKLPPDLQSFLEWLTAPQDDPKALLETTVTPLDFPVASLNEQSLNAHLKYKDKELNNKAQHLVALNDVQDLIKQYHDMNDAEKSKILGIDSYLDNQKKYLDRQIYGYSDIDINNLVTAQERIGRSVPNEKWRRLKRKTRSFKPDTSVKMTNVTSIFEGGNKTINQVSVLDNGNDANINKREFADKHSNKDKDYVKRNLQDVYYRAVTDSKQHTVDNAATQGNLDQKDEKGNIARR